LRRHLPDADEALFRAATSPRRRGRPWLCQLKAAPYSYDWIDNRGSRSPRELTPGLEQLAVGQRVMGLFELVAFEPDRHLTAVLRARGTRELFGELAASYVVVPRGPARARLVVKLVIRWAHGPLAWAMRPLLAWGDLVMMRRQLLTLKALAEGHCARGENPARVTARRSSTR
jgi:hypothetical protein